MPTLIAMAVKWMVQKLGLLLLILAILLVGSWLRNEWQEQRKLSEEIGRQETLLAGLRTELDEKEAALAAETAQWRQQAALATQALLSQLDALNAQIAESERQWRIELEGFSNLKRMAADAATAAARAKRNLVVSRTTSGPGTMFSRPAKVAALEAARAKHAALQKNAQAWKAVHDRAAPRFRASPVEPLYQRRALLSRELDDRAKTVSPRQAQLSGDRERKRQQIQAAEAQLAGQKQQATEDPRSVLFGTIKASLPVALGVLAGILLMPLFIRASSISCWPRSRAVCRRSGSCRMTAPPRSRPRHPPASPSRSMSCPARNSWCSPATCKAAASRRERRRNGC